MTVSGRWSHSSKSSRSAGGRSDGFRKMHRVKQAGAIRPNNHVPVVRSFTDKLNGSNSIGHQLSVVNQ
jgi:hypothetical protein